MSMVAGPRIHSTKSMFPDWEPWLRWHDVQDVMLEQPGGRADIRGSFQKVILSYPRAR
jgi:hypothetical protein